MRMRLTALLLLFTTAASAQTTTTRTDRLIASTQAIVGGTSLGADTLNVTGTLGVTSSTAHVSVLSTGAAQWRLISGTTTSNGWDGFLLGQWQTDGVTFVRYPIAVSSSTGDTRFTGDLIRHATSGSANLFLGDRGDGSDAQRLRAAYDFRNARGVINAYNDTTAAYLPLRIDGNGLGLNIASQADVEFGADAVPEAGYSGNLGSPTRKWLTLHAAELWVQTLVASNVMATIGGRILVAPTTQLSADLGSGAGDATITVKHNNLASGDRIYLEADGKVEFLAVTSGAGGSAGAYTYSVTRDLDGSGRNLWYAGDAVANTGTTGDGFMDIYADRGVASGGYGPTIVGHERLSATYNDWEPRWAVGNLRGLYGYTADTYGAAFGDDDTSNLVIDSTNGIRFRNGTTVLGSWVGSTVTLGQPLTANNTGQIVIDSDSIDMSWRNNSGVTTTPFRISNSGGTTIVAVHGWNVGATTIAPASDGDRIVTLCSGIGCYGRLVAAGMVTVGAPSFEPVTDSATTLGASGKAWSEAYVDAYYVGTTAGVSGTCASVTVVNGIVTGCTP